MHSLVTLHGFLGAPNDWRFLENKGFSAEHLDLFDQKTFHPEKGLWEAGRVVNRNAAHFDSKVLLGYSLGGRIALHALVQNPSFWKAAIIVSTHPGLATRKEKRLRLAHDARWSSRFQKENWESVVKAWNAQPVFGTNQIDRKESFFSRESLSSGLIGWSLGNQSNFFAQLTSLFLPILWITGASDKKFTQIAQKLEFSHSLSSHSVIADAYHRVPWEKTSCFIKKITEFLQQIP